MVERRSGLLPAIAVALLTVLALAVTLPGLEFSNGGENLLVTTAMETRRTGNWLIPTMNNRERVNKPPLPMWLSAVFISDATMAGIGSPDRETRDRALATLNWQVRWPALLASGLTLLVVYELGRTLSGRDERVGWMAAAICASQLLFLRNARLATTDVQLMLWAAVANLCIAKMLLEGRRWGMAIPAGVAIGLGLMSKGPVVLVQTIVPALAMIGWQKWQRRDEPQVSRPSWIPPIAGGLLAMLIVGVPWYLYVLGRVKGVTVDYLAWHWWIEVTRYKATEQSDDEWFGYLSFLPLLLPWMPLFVVGVVTAWRERTSPATRGLVLAVLMAVVPILLMSCFSDRKSRYLLPMAIPAAVVTARGVMACFSHAKARRVVGVTFAVMMVGQAAFMHHYRSSDRGRSEMKPLADQIWASYPNAHVRMTGPRPVPVPADLPLYLNRSVQWLPSLDRLKISNEPCVLIMRQRKGELAPTPPPGWIALEPVRRDSTMWHAFVLVPGK